MGAVKTARPKAALRQGALVRRIARNSIRKSKKASLPGSPPKTHMPSGGFSLKWIFFAVDSAKGSVVVGPIKGNAVYFSKDGQPVRGTVPGILEFSGEIFVLEVHRHGQWQRADLRSRRRIGQYQQRLRKARIAKRPYMNPALETARPMLAKAWEKTVKK